MPLDAKTDYLKCDMESRRSLVRNSAETNGIDYVEVLTNKPETKDDGEKSNATKEEQVRQKDPYRSLIMVRCFHPISKDIDERNVVINGGTRIRNIKVVWARRADRLEKVQDEFSAEEKELAADVIQDKDKVLFVRPLTRGDFSTYTLGLVSANDPSKPAPEFDELLSMSDFSFRVDCQEGFDCMLKKPEHEKNELALQPPNLDYMAKDYASFRRLMLDRLAAISPRWQERNPSDMGIALVELLAYVGDHLSYFQDAVATEAYLGTARRRISIRRHARLLGYYMHEGCNSRAWVFLEVDRKQVQQVKVGKKTKMLALPKGRITGRNPNIDPEKLPEEIATGAQVFETMHDAILYDSHNEIPLYTWADNHCYLVRGATGATLRNDGKKLKLKVGDLVLFEEVFIASNSPRLALQNVLDALPKARSYVWSADASYEQVAEWELLALTAVEQLYGKDSKETRKLSAMIADESWKNTDRPDSMPPEIFVNNAFQARLDAIEKMLNELYSEQPDTLGSSIGGKDSGITTESRPQNDGRLHRHVVRLTKVSEKTDALTGTELLEVSWDRQDALPFRLCVMDKQVTGTMIGIAHGNIVLADYGNTIENISLGYLSPNGPYRLVLPNKGPLTFAMPYDPSKPAAHAFETDPKLALPAVTLMENENSDINGGHGVEWEPRRDLLNSDRFAREFVVETESDGRSYIRFGDSETKAGRIPVTSAAAKGENRSTFTATLRTGNGAGGNVGAGAITAIVGVQGIKSVRNPLEARGGTEPEDIEHVRKFAPGSFMKQCRAVTEQDYNDLLTAHDEIQKARAVIRWTGSWHTVFIAIDRIGGLLVDGEFEQRILNYLDNYRLAGYDIEIHAAKYVPLYLSLRVRVAEGYFKEHVHAALADAFSSKNTHGFFNPDKWTFGQPAYLSQVYAAATNVEGVAAVEVEAFSRQERPHDETGIRTGVVQVGMYEIARLDNDPDFPENGKIEFAMEGGV